MLARLRSPNRIDSFKVTKGSRITADQTVYRMANKAFNGCCVGFFRECVTSSR